MANKFRVLFIPALELTKAEFISETVFSYEQAVAIKDAIATYTLMLHEHSIMKDFSNIALIEECVDGEWLEADFDEYEI